MHSERCNRGRACKLEHSGAIDTTLWKPMQIASSGQVSLSQPKMVQ
jgi:hypothetical protein